MPALESESIILRTHDLSEADRIVVFYTRLHGLTRGVAKGAKRMNSKFGSSLEPFSKSNISYFLYEDRELVSIQNVELIRSSFETAAGPEVLATWSYMAELMQAIVPPHDPDEVLFRMIDACLTATEPNSCTLAALTLYFETWLLRIGGFFPRLDICGECGRPVGDHENAVRSIDFGMSCSDCRQISDANILTSADRRLFESIRRNSPAAVLAESENKAESIRRGSEMTKRLISALIRKEFKNLTFRVSI